MAGSAGALGAALLRGAPVGAGNLHLATFRFEVTPPPGHSLCGGWIKPAEAVDDPLEAIGLVLLGAGPPIVICAVDWTGILNESHLEWRTALAAAAGTTPDWVAVHCVHQHDAPLVCAESARLVELHGDLPRVFERDFHRRCLDDAQAAIAAALPRARPVTHVAHGSAGVEAVASNRRLARDTAGRITRMRGSSCRDPALIALPEGPIDPLLRTVAFYDRDEKIAACHYYATHPMSHYGAGRVSSDFCGLARKRRQREEPGCTQLYFTGCAGNIAAGKYNDGSAASRLRLTERIHRAMMAASAALRPVRIARVAWRTAELHVAPNPALGPGALRELMTKRADALAPRMRPAFKLALMERCARRVPFVLGALHVDDLAVLHLPAEPFVEFQVHAQARRPGKFVATAAYGDGGPWYVPVREEFAAGGYEVEFAFCAPETDAQLRGAIDRLLA
ncbi:MAG: hypothetical protein JNL39_14765 [Opitutaceae bacterium]|nr:hypothetical protein [Opitutaceae bacterium]